MSKISQTAILDRKIVICYAVTSKLKRLAIWVATNAGGSLNGTHFRTDFLRMQSWH